MLEKDFYQNEQNTSFHNHTKESLTSDTNLCNKKYGFLSDPLTKPSTINLDSHFINKDLGIKDPLYYLEKPLSSYTSFHSSLNLVAFSYVLLPLATFIPSFFLISLFLNFISAIDDYDNFLNTHNSYLYKIISISFITYIFSMMTFKTFPINAVSSFIISTVLAYFGLNKLLKSKPIGKYIKKGFDFFR